MDAWKFDLTQYETVWTIAINLLLLLFFLLLGNVLRRTIPFLRKAFIPSALIGGLLFLGTYILFKNVFHIEIADQRIMQIVTYHALGIGFIGMSLKTLVKEKKKGNTLKVFQNGFLTGGVYMLQGVVGLAISLIFFYSGASLFYASGVILPLGFGQGPGNALTWDINFGQYGFDGNGSFGLTIASIGFIVASVVGVIYINIYKKKGHIVEKIANQKKTTEHFEGENEIEDCESVDKTSIQIAFVALSYLLSFLTMLFFAKLTEWTGIKIFNDIAWGFNFIWGVLAATAIKNILKLLEKKKIVKRKYINNYQMDRISGFAFDLMIIAGVVAIDINIVAKYAWAIIILSAVGTVATLAYTKWICRKCFPDYEHEVFLMNFGALTGTASNGMILLREIDPNFETPAGNIYILSQFPAMIAVAPLLFLLNMCAKSILGCFISFGIFFLLLIVYTLFLLLSAKRSAKNK